MLTVFREENGIREKTGGKTVLKWSREKNVKSARQKDKKGADLNLPKKENLRKQDYLRSQK